MEESLLQDLFFEGPSTSTEGTRLDNDNLKSWLCGPAPSIDDLPQDVDLQKEAHMPFAAIRQPKKFTPPLMKVNALESKSQGPYASQHGIHFNTKVTPNTGNTRAVNVTATYPWFSSGNKKAAGTDFLPPEQNLLQSQDISGSPSLLRRSLFRTFEEEQMLTYNNSINTEKPYKTDSNRPFHQNPLVYNEEDDVCGASGKETCSFPSTPLLTRKAETQCGILRPVSEIPKQFRTIFKEFPYFNYIQSKALDDLLYSNNNFVMCAPTGSGKTVIFELAIVRLLMEVPAPWTNIKIVYMAPIKALCGQRFDNWKEKFEPIGLQCKELTGDTEMDDLFEIQHAHIIMTTPEKWDSMSRKWRDNTLVQLVRLFLIDEVHTVKDESRGATLEVVVSRMKTMQILLASTNSAEVQLPMRFVAVSATIPNADDIAEWLSDGQCRGICMKMDESHRPVKLRKVVLGYPSGANQTEYKFDLTLNYKISGVIQTYSDQKPTLVFCATRKGVQQAASILAKDAKFIMSIQHKQRLQKSTNAVKDGKLRDLMLYGVGYHHAGMDMSDRKIIEGTFTEGDLPVLFTTSTLAMGVNLPAHLVIIKSTMHYSSGMFQEYSETDILQMIGRAGRPQFDSTATAVIMTRSSTKEKYIQMLDGADTIESSLHRHLVEHLNAEITLHTITDVNIALEWIRSTFLYIRTLKNPSHYGFQRGLDKVGIEAELQELCLRNLNDLSSVGLIEMDEEVNFKPTETGKLLASYYIAFDTAQLFYSIHGKETLSDLITIISSCKEFSDIQLRTSEKKILNTMNRDKNRTTIRFPLEGKIKTREMKVNCLIQAQLGCIPVQDFSLTQDMAKIFRHGIRVTKYLYEFLALQEKKFMAFLNAFILAKCFRCKLWENSLHVSKQLEKIGVTLANAMVNAGLTSFKKIEDTNPRELELIVNRNPPFGNQIKETVLHLPTYKLSIEQLAKYNLSDAEIVVTILLTNYERLQKKRTAPDSHHIMLLIGDSDNNILFKQKIMDSALLKSGTWIRKINIKRAFASDELSVNLISSEYVGLDIQQTFRAVYLGTQKLEPNIGAESSNSNMQLTFGCPSLQTVLKSGMRECNHHCKNKEACGHECCKIGVSHKADSKTNSNFSSYLSDLRSRNSVSSAPPVKRLKMQGERTTSLQKFVYTTKPGISALLWPSAEEQTVTQEPFHVHQTSYTDQPPDGTSCIFSVKTAYGNQQNKNMSNNQKTFGDLVNYSSWSLEPASVTFDLGNDIWDDFDDDSLLSDSSFVTSVEAPIPAGSCTVPFRRDLTATYSSSSAQQKNTDLVSKDVIKKNTEYTIQNNDLENKGASNYRPYGKRPDDLEQYLKNRNNSSGIYNMCQSRDFFISNTTAHANDSRDEETQTFIGIFDGVF